MLPKFRLSLNKETRRISGRRERPATLIGKFKLMEEKKDWLCSKQYTILLILSSFL